MTYTETRPCEHCRRPFTWSSRYPTRRFCDPRCKARWAREPKNARRRELRRLRKAGQQHDRHPEPGNHANPNNHGNREDREDRDGHQPLASTANAVRNCPHCHHPIAVFNLLLTPDAAYVNTPSRSVT